MNFIKRNKTIIIALVVFFTLILLCVQIKNILIPNEGRAVYGNRLDGRMEISKDAQKKIKEELSSAATSVTVKRSGRIINITITLYGNVSRDAAKSYAQKTLDFFTDEEKSYYDFQFYLTKEEEQAEFPIIGYKIQNSEKISWTKDR